MPEYMWRGINRQGANCGGIIKAATPALAQEELFNQAIALLSMQKKEESAWGFLFKPLFQPKKLSLVTIELFFEHCGMLLGSGIDLIATLKSCARSFIKSPLEPIINDLMQSVMQGKRFYEAFEKHASLFPGYTVSLLATAERTGTMASIFAHMATIVREQTVMRGRIKKALLSPVITLIFAIIMSLSIIIFIVPQLQAIVGQMGGVVPRSTQWLFWLSSVLRSRPVVLGFCIMGILFYGLFIRVKKSSKLIFLGLNFFMQLPLIGAIIREQALITLLHHLSLYLEAGATLSQGLMHVRDYTPSVITRQLVGDMLEKLMQGKQFCEILQEYPDFFPASVIALVDVGMQTGTLPGVLAKARLLVAGALNRKLEIVMTLVNPCAMALLGLVVVVLLVALYLPIFTIATVPRW